MWEKEEDDVEALEHLQYLKVDDKLELDYGTLNSLLCALTQENLANGSETEVFLLTLHKFTTPSVVLEKLIERYNVPQRIAKNIGMIIQARVANFLYEWLEKYHGDFSPGMLLSLQKLLLTTPKSHSSLVSRALQENEQLKKKTKKARIHSTLPTPVNLLSLSSNEFACQLTLVEFERFSLIQPREFIDLAWTRENKQHLAPNVMNIIRHFNGVYWWLIDSVLQLEDANARSKRLSWFIEVAQHLIEIKNFNSFMTVLAGLESAFIARLRHTQSLLSKATLQHLENIRDFGTAARGFWTLRTAVKSAIPPSICYLGLKLTDLTFIEEGNRDLLSDGSINFSKLRNTHKTISTIMATTQIPFPFAENIAVTNALRNLTPAITEAEAYELSLKREPRRRK